MVEVASHQNSDANSQYNNSLMGILIKLNALLEEEMSALSEGNHKTLEEFARKKISLFSQLRVLGTRYGDAKLSGENVEEAKRLKLSLFANLQKLELQMNAMKELNSTIEQAVLKDQSDGTYSIGEAAMRGYV